MTDLERDLRDMMQRTADGVHHVQRPSRGLVRRARLRRARTAALAGAAALALVIGGFAGARSLSSDEAVPPANPDSNRGTTPGPTTTENGQTLPEHRSLLDGEVTFRFGPPWTPSILALQHGPTWTTLDGEGSVVVIADPLPVETGCRKGPAPADAEALAQSIRSDPDLEATDPGAARIAGIEALRMDVVVATGASVCQEVGPPVVLRPRSAVTAGYMSPGDRMRLYLLDLPGRSARILAIAIIAQQSSFEDAIEAATPIVDSFEFRTE